MRVSVALDPIACDGHGLCALWSEAIDLDEWGFPVLHQDLLADPRVLRGLRRAARACPRGAIIVGEQVSEEVGSR